MGGPRQRDDKKPRRDSPLGEREAERLPPSDAAVTAIPPVMIKSPGNPGGLPLSAFEEIRQRVATNHRSQFYEDRSARVV